MFVIHEDDWRQVEFVSDELLGDVETEIADISTIYENKRKGAGFTGMHIRKLIERPIDDGAIPYTALKNLSQSQKSSAVSASAVVWLLRSVVLPLKRRADSGSTGCSVRKVTSSSYAWRTQTDLQTSAERW